MSVQCLKKKLYLIMGKTILIGEKRKYLKIYKLSVAMYSELVYKHSVCKN